MDIRNFFGSTKKKKSAASYGTTAKTIPPSASSTNRSPPSLSPTLPSSAAAAIDERGSSSSSSSGVSPRRLSSRRDSPHNGGRGGEETMKVGGKKRQGARGSVVSRRETQVDSDEDEDHHDEYDFIGIGGADNDEEDYSEQAKKKRAMARENDRKYAGGKSCGGGGRGRKKIGAEEDDEENEFMMEHRGGEDEDGSDDNDNDASDDGDDDFSPEAMGVNDDDDDDDDDDDKDVDERQKRKLRGIASATSTTIASRASSPGRNKRAAASPPSRREAVEKKQKKKKNEDEEERLTMTVATTTTTMKKTTTTTKPPKYHPPSSKIALHIPYLLKTGLVDPIHATADALPKLPMNDDFPNFSIDGMASNCLEGLTFVFTGILSTCPNDNVVRKTNTDLMASSPSKGDYYASRTMHDAGSVDELSREAAIDVIKCLGGRVTTAVSGRTDYLIAGNVLEDGRDVEEGSKYRKCVDMWGIWRDKHRAEYASAGNDDDDDGDENETKTKIGKEKRQQTKRKDGSKDGDPNTLVEVIRGIREFYGMVVYLSDWKGGRTTATTVATTSAAAVEVEGNDESKSGPSSSMVAAAALAPTSGSNRTSTSNPYIVRNPPPSTVVANPYARATVANPYAARPSTSSSTTAAMSNPYAKKAMSSSSLPSNDGNAQHRQQSTAKSNIIKAPLHPGSGKELGINSLWADKYAPSHSSDILGNADSVVKLSKWLSSWERTFNGSNKSKSLGGPNGPFKAALLSGPPGIGKTTTATLVARESGRDVLELNASDARSKKALNEALGDVTGSQVLSFDNMGRDDDQIKKSCQRRCIVMDEVDGMGAGDRSGMSELIQMIKKSKVPIICICNDRSSPKMKTLVQYCLDLRYRRPTKMVIARRAIEIGRLEGMHVEINAAEAMAESCGNDIRQVLNSLQMWSCNKRKANCGGSADSETYMTYRDLKERQHEINKDEVLRVSMFDACRSIVEGSRGLAGADSKAVTASLMKRTDAFFVDYMMMGLMVHQNYLKVCMGGYSSAKLGGDADVEVGALDQIYEATAAMSDFGMCEESLRGGDQNWSLLPLCSVLAVKVGYHAGGPTGGFLPGYPEFAGWLGKNSTRNKKIRLLQEFRRHMNYKISADAPELRMNYLPIIRQQLEALLFHQDGAKVNDAISLMDDYGLDRDDVFENLDEFLFNSKEHKVKKFGDLDSKSKSAFTRAYNSIAHKAQALVSEQGAEKTGRKKTAGGGGEMEDTVELDVVDDDKAIEEESDDDDDEEELEALKKTFLKKGNAKGASKANGKKGNKK